MRIIGVDAGATKTEAVAYTPAGSRIAQVTEGTGNMVVDRQAAMNNILRAILRVLPEDAGEVYVCVGAAGIESGDNRPALRAHLSAALPQARLRIANDAHLALYAAHKGANGMIVIAGTGSIAFAKRGDALLRAGGWGQLLGDEGSGYDIVRRAFQRVTLEYEAGARYTGLSQCLLTHLETDVFGAVQFIHRAAKGDIAALLPQVTACAEQGEPAALTLLAEAGDTLALMAARLYRNSGFDAPLPVACIGSVLTHIAPVREAFQNTLAARCPALRVDPSVVYPPDGALPLFGEDTPT